MEIRISPLTSMKEAEEIANLQKLAWQMDDIGVVPIFETKAVSDAGFVYVAKREEEVIGFIYGYHHFPDIHYSHMMAVLPKYQGMNVGYELKKYHRQQALESEFQVTKIQWTVDPLLPNNAYLNFAKLGGFCDTYKVNYYGDPDSDGVGIYAGVPTDRFKLTWPILAQRVERRMKDYREERINLTDLFRRSPLINKIEDNTYKSVDVSYSNSFCVEVPSNYQEIRENHVDIAIDWRMKFREVTLNALDQDYIVADYHSVGKDNDRRNFYEFTKKEEFTGFT